MSRCCTLKSWLPIYQHMFFLVSWHTLLLFHSWPQRRCLPILPGCYWQFSTYAGRCYVFIKTPCSCCVQLICLVLLCCTYASHWFHVIVPRPEKSGHAHCLSPMPTFDASKGQSCIYLDLVSWCFRREFLPYSVREGRISQPAGVERIALNTCPSCSLLLCMTSILLRRVRYSCFC